jgi:hypothetical protein
MERIKTTLKGGIGVDRHNYCSCKHTTEGDDPLINSYHAELYTQDITCMLNCFEEISQNLHSGYFY